MKPIDYDYWFSFDYWTYEQAAYLLSNINPDDQNHIDLIKNPKYIKINPGGYASADTFNRYLKLIKGTDFKKYGSSEKLVGKNIADW